jgi:hypothetical protein
MKRYYVFGYDAYYPGGGWSDFKKSFINKDAAIAYADSLKCGGGIEVIDIKTEEDIYIYPHYRVIE